MPKVSSDDPRPQQLGHLDILPAMSKPAGKVTPPEFEGYNETIERLNEKLKTNPIQGIHL